MNRRRREAFGNDDDFKEKNECPKFPDMDCECPECRRIQAVAREHERLRLEAKNIRSGKII